MLREDNRAGYAPTQVIAEAFREHGYDGIAYGSAFGEGRANIVLFDIGAAELVACELHEIRNVKLIHEETENPYFVHKNEDGSTCLVSNVITAIEPIDGPIVPISSEDDPS